MKTTQNTLQEILNSKEAHSIKEKKHLINTDSFSADEINCLMATARHLKQLSNDTNQFPLDLLKSSHVALAFYENSTRTKCSFNIAASNLGANVLDLNVDTSSSQKGENLIDTAATLIEMGVNAYIQRHSEEGVLNQMVSALGDSCSFINAGEGKQTHPTQALLDYFTMLDLVSSIENKKVTIVGDTKYSRVARSNARTLTKMGADVHVASPESLMADDLAELGVTLHTNLEEAIKDCHFIMALRIQFERQGEAQIIGKEAYIKNYQLNHSVIKSAKESVHVMHPGPVNRDLEITSELADDKNLSLIRQQVANGVFVRMAILALLLN